MKSIDQVLQYEVIWDWAKEGAGELYARKLRKRMPCIWISMLQPASSITNRDRKIIQFQLQIQ